jgi:capsular exopolysaccharide synthesis family protein
VLISADLRRPRLHEFFGLEPERGLADVLIGQRRPWESLKSGGPDNLWVMSSGHIPEQPTELLQSPTMQELITDQREVVDFIVIDCPPVLAVADALVIAPLVDGVIFVADAMSTPRGAVIQARAQLDQVGARMLGAVLNNVEAGSSGYAYYGAQYSYAPTSQATSSPNGKARAWETLRRERS